MKKTIIAAVFALAAACACAQTATVSGTVPAYANGSISASAFGSLSYSGALNSSGQFSATLTARTLYSFMLKPASGSALPIFSTQVQITAAASQDISQQLQSAAPAPYITPIIPRIEVGSGAPTIACGANNAFWIYGNPGDQSGANFYWCDASTTPGVWRKQTGSGGGAPTAAEIEAVLAADPFDIAAATCATGSIIRFSTTDGLIVCDPLLTDAGGQFIFSDGNTDLPTFLTLTPNSAGSLETENGTGWSITSAGVSGIIDTVGSFSITSSGGVFTNEFGSLNAFFSGNDVGTNGQDEYGDTYGIGSGSAGGNDLNNSGGSYSVGVSGVGISDGTGGELSLGNSALQGHDGSSPSNGFLIAPSKIVLSWGDADASLEIDNASGCSGTPGPETLTGYSNGEAFTLPITCL